MATVPVTRTFVAGEIVLASYFNANIRDVNNYLLAPPVLELNQIVAQSVPNNAFTAFTFTSEVVDSSGMHDNVTNNSRGTAVYPGWYRMSGATAFAPNGTASRGAQLAVNAVALTGGTNLSITVGAAHNHAQVVRTKLAFLNVSDYGQLLGFQLSGGALNSVAGGSDCASFSMKWESN